jgi:PadR family transcriptional regulator PadR
MVTLGIMGPEASGAATALENWREQLRRGGLDLAILLAVAPGPRYGLELIRYLEEYTDLVVAEGTVYPILARLARDGLIRPEWVTRRGPHPRKYYHLTNHGRRQLDNMLEHWDDFVEKIGRLVRVSEGRET